jgi:uncharacterized delta-60 repeat protein
MGGGSYFGSTTDFSIVRFNSNGSIDTTFGQSFTGVATVDFAGNFDDVYALAVQANGNIVAAGRVVDASGVQAFGLTRLTPNGLVDSFGAGGRVITDVGGQAYAKAISVDASGAIIAAGHFYSGAHNVAIAHYLADGTLDSTFGAGGVATAGFFSGGVASIETVAITPDGAIVAAGTVSTGASYDFAVKRYLASGQPDATFGELTTEFSGGNDFAHAVTAQADGRVIVAGIAGNANFDFGVARYAPSAP